MPPPEHHAVGVPCLGMADRLRSFMLVASMALLFAGTTLVSPGMAASEPPSAELPDRTGPTVREIDDPRLAEFVLDAFSSPGESTIVGTLLQSASRPGPPGSDVAAVEEWFVETKDGRVLAIAVPLAVDESTRLGGEERRGSLVRLEGRPVGTLEAESRDGLVRRWPLFAGRPVPAASASSAGVAVVAATLAAAAIWFLIRRGVAGRRGTPGQPTIPSHAEEPEPPMDLPGDPADALAVLATRANDAGGNPRSDPMPDREAEA